jgi:hypothetical protein
MSHQQCFEFAREENARKDTDRHTAELSINQKLRKLQSLPNDDPKKDVLANEILQWILTR